MQLKIEYRVFETIDIPNDTPSEITQVIVEDTVDGAINFLQRHGFEAGLKKIERKP